MVWDLGMYYIINLQGFLPSHLRQRREDSFQIPSLSKCLNLKSWIWTFFGHCPYPADIRQAPVLPKFHKTPKNQLFTKSQVLSFYSDPFKNKSIHANQYSVGILLLQVFLKLFNYYYSSSSSRSINHLQSGMTRTARKPSKL